MAIPVVLASSSPRRRELLEKAGLEFTVDPAENDETPARGLAPEELARSLSLMKAQSAAGRHPRSIVIAADTFGILDGTLLGKPADAAGARRMLRLMSGKCHAVITGFTVMDTASGRAVSRVAQTAVCFKRLSGAQIDKYVATGEPLDKAGAYAIQGEGAALIERIDGDYFNVVGLPLHALAEVLKEFGIGLPGLVKLSVPPIPLPGSP
jgi:septum formation protein